MRLRLDLAYDGTAFSGWARQPGLRTAAGELEAALARVLRLPGPPATVVAGRTDAGVHASGQVVHVDVPAAAWAAAPGRSGRAPGDALVAGLAGVLDGDLVVRAAAVAPDGFDARFSALRRHYAYRLSDAPGGAPPLRRRDVVAVPPAAGELDVAAMDAAARSLEGLHDFAAFCRPREGATTVRTLLRHRWRRAGGAEGPDAGLVVAEVVADAFCHSMVRALVGAVLAVGTGRRGTDWPARVLAAGVRDPAVQVAPARGLVLVRVDYPDAAADPGALARRAERARSRRDAPAPPWQPAPVTEMPQQSSAARVDPAASDDDLEVRDVAPEPAAHDGVLEMMDSEDDEHTSAQIEQGYSPDDREHRVGRFGMTADEELAGETIDERLKEEEPDLPVGSGGAYGAGQGDAPADLPTDGEPLDDEVGFERAGRLVEPDGGASTDTEKSAVATDAGVDGGGATAEEAAVHVVPEEDDDRL